MNVKLFGYSISLNVIILIGILYLIMVVNALSASCNMEGLKGPAGKAKRQKNREDEEQEAAEVFKTQIDQILSATANMPKPLSPSAKQNITERLNNLGSKAPNAEIANYVKATINRVRSM